MHAIAFFILHLLRPPIKIMDINEARTTLLLRSYRGDVAPGEEGLEGQDVVPLVRQPVPCKCSCIVGGQMEKLSTGYDGIAFGPHTHRHDFTGRLADSTTWLNDGLLILLSFSLSLVPS